MKSLCRTIVAGLVVAFTTSTLTAQAPNLNPRAQPAVSPYVNLLRSGSDPAINYFGIVRPEIAFRNSIYQLQQQQDTQEQSLAGYMTVPPTGRTSGFMTQSRYFMTRGARGTATARPQPPAGARPGTSAGR